MFKQFKLIFLAFLAFDFVSSLHNLKVHAACPKKKCPTSTCSHHDEKEAKHKCGQKEKEIKPKCPTKGKEVKPKCPMKEKETKPKCLAKQNPKEKNTRNKCSMSAVKAIKSETTGNGIAFMKPVMMTLKNCAGGGEKYKGGEQYKSKSAAYV